MAIIPCVHDKNTNVPQSSSPEDFLIVKTSYHRLIQLIYHHHDGRLMSTPSVPRTALTRSRPFNPFCQRCVPIFLFYLTKLGFPQPTADQLLLTLQEHVLTKVPAAAGTGGCRVLEPIDCELRKVDEIHSRNVEDYYAWIIKYHGLQVQYDDEGGPAAARGDFSYYKVERVEDEEVVKMKGEKCTVCYDEIEGETKEEQGGVMKLGCGHVFHGACIVEWISTNPLCPLCRFQVPLATA